MDNQYNPFKDNRAEQMRELWKYYVPFPGLEGTGKPVVVQGGRGSGKTMFFQCNSWKEVLSKLRKEGKPVSELFDSQDFVGIYYRVDTSFVSSMRGRKEENWESIFETYFSICILQEMIDLLIVLEREMEIDENRLLLFINDFSRRILPESHLENLHDFKRATDYYLDKIENKINGYQDDTAPMRKVNAHRFISDLCCRFNELADRTVLFKIFIDEYETLQEYQQRIINTLIKHSTLPVIFNIGMKPKGMKTIETISETETIEAPHDYELLNLGFDTELYQGIIKEICQKRIILSKEMGKIPKNASDDIGYYLGNYSLEYEIQKITQGVTKFSYLSKLEECIRKAGAEANMDEEAIDKCVSTLCYDAPVINSRIHFALLGKKTTYTPSLVELYDAYTKHTQRYSDWFHNRKHGAVFLLCKEKNREKMYFGLDAYLALSSYNVRYFLELCEQAFRIAFSDNFNWDKPISPEIQSEASRYVSEYKIIDIAACEPYGHELRLFIQYLGQIFNKLHTLEDSTLGEPEPNHFSTKDLSLPETSRQVLDSAIMWNVLLEGEPTKRKQSILSPETIDYYINRIYVPYFGISYRNQRKIQLTVEILNQLLSGDEAKAKIGFRHFFNTKQEDSPDSFLEDTKQFSIFEQMDGELPL